MRALWLLHRRLVPPAYAVTLGKGQFIGRKFSGATRIFSRKQHPKSVHKQSPPWLHSRQARTLHVCAATGVKVKQVWECEECGESSTQWTGKCKNCQEWNTLRQVEVIDESSKAIKGGGGGSAAVREALSFSGGSSSPPPASQNGGGKKPAVEQRRPSRGAWTTNTASPQRLSDVLKQGGGVTWRLPLAGATGAEVSRVLGGGIVPGSLTLFSGDPGIGKSTMLLQMADLIASIEPIAMADAEPGSPMRESDAVLYITAEESVDQVSNRADRMGLMNAKDNIYLYSATQMSEILRQILSMRPRAVIVDSIQTVYLDDVNGSAGSISQVRECTTALMRVAKDQRIPIFIVGHVTKSGDVAGPKVLEHIVDTTLYMEGEHGQTFRLLRVNKNRFGKTDEIGVFSMDESGLQPVPNPSAFFLTDRNKPHGASSAISVTMGGSRPMLVEIQALCTPFHPGQGAPLRAQNGVQKARLSQILAILQKFCKMNTYTFNIHTNVVGGFILNEPATDLAVGVAIASSIQDRPVRSDIAFVGECGLGGELRPISNLERRVAEASKLGFTACVVPEGSPKLKEKRFHNIELIYCSSIDEAIKVSLFT